MLDFRKRTAIKTQRFVIGVSLVSIAALASGCGGAAAPTTTTVTQVTTVETTVTETATSTPSTATPSTAAETKSTHGAKIEVPNAVGKDYQSAQDLWRGAGLVVGVAKDATGAHRLPLIDSNWVVLSQDPAAGTKVAEDSVIIATIKKLSDG